MASVGDVLRFPTGRHFASFLGLTPRERSSGLTRHLGTISKRGDTYLRGLLVNGVGIVFEESLLQCDVHLVSDCGPVVAGLAFNERRDRFGN